MPPAKAVLDTNVIVSALLKQEGRQAHLLDLALSGAFVLVVSPALLEEYEEVLRRPRFRLDPGKVARTLRVIRSGARIVQPRRQILATRDPDDNMVLECAVEGSAEFVVTGNARDFPKEFQGIRIILPREFMLILAERLE